MDDAERERYDQLELDLIDVRQELDDARREFQSMEAAPMDGRVVDEDRYMVALLRLQSRVRALEEEEARLERELT